MKRKAQTASAILVASLFIITLAAGAFFLIDSIQQTDDILFPRAVKYFKGQCKDTRVYYKCVNYVDVVKGDENKLLALQGKLSCFKIEMEYNIKENTCSYKSNLNWDGSEYDDEVTDLENRGIRVDLDSGKFPCLVGQDFEETDGLYSKLVQCRINDQICDVIYGCITGPPKSPQTPP